MDPSAHKALTGADNARTLANIRMLDGELGKKLMLRMPLIPGCNNSAENLKRTAAFAQEVQRFGAVGGFQCVALSRHGTRQYDLFGLKYSMADTQPPTQNDIDTAIAVFAGAGLPVVQGG